MCRIGASERSSLKPLRSTAFKRVGTMDHCTQPSMAMFIGALAEVILVGSELPPSPGQAEGSIGVEAFARKRVEGGECIVSLLAQPGESNLARRGTFGSVMRAVNSDIQKRNVPSTFLALSGRAAPEPRHITPLAISHSSEYAQATARI